MISVVVVVFLSIFFVSIPFIRCSFSILEQESRLITKVSEAEFELRCTGSQVWQFCRWSHNNNDCSRTKDITPSTCPIHEDVRWRDEGLGSSCLIRVTQPIRERDSGEWRCQLVANASVTATFVYDVDVLEPTTVAFASKPQHTMREGKEYRVDCVARGGNPTPILKAYVGDESMTSTSNMELESLKTLIDETSVSKLFRLKPNMEMRQSYVKCVALQPNPLDISMNAFEPSIVSQRFEVVFHPIPLYSSSSLTFFFDPSMPLEIAVDFLARPMPKNEMIVWHVVHSDPNLSQTIPVGSIQGRYTALPIEKSNYVATAKLIVDATTTEDEELYWYLEVINGLGRTELPFQLLVRPQERDPFEEVASNDGEDSTATIVILVIIGMVSIVVFIALLLLLYLRKEEDQCCLRAFGAKSRRVHTTTYVDVARSGQNNEDQHLYVQRPQEVDGR